MATIPDYQPTQWVNDSAPAINASNLNKIENQIDIVSDAVIALEDSSYTLPYADANTKGGIRLDLVNNGDGTFTCNIWTTD